jgi:hypothetical protein
MTWPNQEIITPGVINMLRVNMNLKDGEKLLVVSDVPRIVVQPKVDLILGGPAIIINGKWQ